MSTSSSIDESKIGQPYKGPMKHIWKDGTKIQVPDLESFSNPFVPTTVTNHDNNNTIREFKYERTIDQVLTATDRFQFDRLKTDEQRYAFVRNMISGIDNSLRGIYKLSDGDIGDGTYIGGDPRSLQEIFADLIQRKKVYINPRDGNLYHFQYAIDHKMVEYPCRYCSKVLYSEEHRTRHVYSHMQYSR